MTTINEFVKLDENGDAIIILSKPLTIAGVKVAAMKMREPTVKDQLVMDATEGTDAQKEIAFFATLTGQAPTDLHGLKSRDYRRLQAAFSLFTD